MRKAKRKRILLVLLLTLIAESLNFTNNLASNIGSSQLQSNPGRLAALVRNPFAIGAGIIVIGAVLSVVIWLASEKESGTAEIDTSKEVERAVEALAVKLRYNTYESEALHMINRPAPIPVRWDNAPDRLIAPWSTIRRNRDNTSPLDLSGSIEQIAEIFARVPSGRLVVLGGRGSGKTVIARRFILSMLPTADEGPNRRPLPVLFPMASWDPGKKFRDWLAEELIDLDPALDRLMPSGKMLANELIARRRILPVLDGLDEMASSVRAEALRALSESLWPDDQVLVTSRLTEYSAAVRQVGPLAEAAAVVIEDLQVEDLNEYFGTAPAAGQGDSWSSVLAGLAAAESGSSPAALREVLKTPLMAFMARTVYQVPRANPKDLLTIGDANAIRAQLFRRFVPAAYDEGPGTRTTRHSHNRVIKAERYLRTLATHLADMGTINFRWWQLHQALNRREQAFVGAVAGMAVAGLLLLLVTPFGIVTSSLDALSLGILLGCLAGFAIRRPTLLGRKPSPCRYACAAGVVHKPRRRGRFRRSSH